MHAEVELSLNFDIKGRNFSNAGTISTKIKEILQELGIPMSIIRRTAIAAYEAEMNVVMYADKAKLTLCLTPAGISIRFSTATDEIREMGFGAGMGLPNIKKNSDKMKISSIPGKGTSLDIFFNLSKVSEQ